MQFVTMKRVTIVAEAIIEERILNDLLTLGSSGYTITKAEGRGSRGVRASEWEGRNVKIETVVKPELAQKIMEQLAKQYFAYFAVIMYAHDVEVVRGDKYT